MAITQTAVTNGAVYTNGKLTVTVTNDERFFTVYDLFNRPVGTITRPRIGQRFWTSHTTNGTECTGHAVGPRTALLALITELGA